MLYLDIKKISNDEVGNKFHYSANKFKYRFAVNLIRTGLNMIQVQNIINASPWISTTDKPNIAVGYGSDNGVIIINRRKIQNKIIYAPFEISDDGNFYNDMTLDMARRDGEYLVYLEIPQ